MPVLLPLRTDRRVIAAVDAVVVVACGASAATAAAVLARWLVHVTGVWPL